MILLIDNYDSFSYNLYQLVGELSPDIRVIRNDELSVEEIFVLRPSHIILSPGPGRPENAGVLIPLLQKAKGDIPILGVCLGHQAICAAFGAEVTYARELMHGKQSPITFLCPSPLFAGLGQSLSVARYHSLAAAEDTMPPCLRATAVADDGEIMAVEHTTLPIYGVQFHPESILTPQGKEILQNFIAIQGGLTYD